MMSFINGFITRAPEYMLGSPIEAMHEFLPVGSELGDIAMQTGERITGTVNKDMLAQVEATSSIPWFENDGKAWYDPTSWSPKRVPEVFNKAMSMWGENLPLQLQSVAAGAVAKTGMNAAKKAIIKKIAARAAVRLAAGAAAAAAGAEIGAAAGSVVPGAGTAVGGTAGAILGVAEWLFTSFVVGSEIMALTETTNFAKKARAAGMDDDIVASHARSYGQIAGMIEQAQQLINIHGARGVGPKADPAWVLMQKAGFEKAVVSMMKSVKKFSDYETVEHITEGMEEVSQDSIFQTGMFKAQEDMRGRYGDAWQPKEAIVERTWADAADSFAGGALLSGMNSAFGHMRRFVTNRVDAEQEESASKEIATVHAGRFSTPVVLRQTAIQNVQAIESLAETSPKKKGSIWNAQDQANEERIKYDLSDAAKIDIAKIKAQETMDGKVAEWSRQSGIKVVEDNATSDEIMRWVQSKKGQVKIDDAIEAGGANLMDMDGSLIANLNDAIRFAHVVRRVVPIEELDKWKVDFTRGELNHTVDVDGVPVAMGKDQQLEADHKLATLLNITPLSIDRENGEMQLHPEDKARLEWSRKALNLLHEHFNSPVGASNNGINMRLAIANSATATREQYVKWDKTKSKDELDEMFSPEGKNFIPGGIDAQGNKLPDRIRVVFSHVKPADATDPMARMSLFIGSGPHVIAEEINHIVAMRPDSLPEGSKRNAMFTDLEDLQIKWAKRLYDKLNPMAANARKSMRLLPDDQDPNVMSVAERKSHLTSQINSLVDTLEREVPSTDRRKQNTINNLKSVAAEITNAQNLTASMAQEKQKFIMGLRELFGNITPEEQLVTLHDTLRKAIVTKNGYVTKTAMRHLNELFTKYYTYMRQGHMSSVIHSDRHLIKYLAMTKDEFATADNLMRGLLGDALYKHLQKEKMVEPTKIDMKWVRDELAGQMKNLGEDITPPEREQVTGNINRLSELIAQLEQIIAIAQKNNVPFTKNASDFMRDVLNVSPDMSVGDRLAAYENIKAEVQKIIDSLKDSIVAKPISGVETNTATPKTPPAIPPAETGKAPDLSQQPVIKTPAQLEADRAAEKRKSRAKREADAKARSRQAELPMGQGAAGAAEGSNAIPPAAQAAPAAAQEDVASIQKAAKDNFIANLKNKLALAEKEFAALNAKDQRRLSAVDAGRQIELKAQIEQMKRSYPSIVESIDKTPGAANISEKNPKMKRVDLNDLTLAMVNERYQRITKTPDGVEEKVEEHGKGWQEGNGQDIINEIEKYRGIIDEMNEYYGDSRLAESMLAHVIKKFMWDIESKIDAIESATSQTQIDEILSIGIADEKGVSDPHYDRFLSAWKSATQKDGKTFTAGYMRSFANQFRIFNFVPFTMIKSRRKNGVTTKGSFVRHINRISRTHIFKKKMLDIVDSLASSRTRVEALQKYLRALNAPENNLGNKLSDGVWEINKANIARLINMTSGIPVEISMSMDDDTFNSMRAALRVFARDFLSNVNVAAKPNELHDALREVFEKLYTKAEEFGQTPNIEKILGNSTDYEGYAIYGYGPDRKMLLTALCDSSLADSIKAHALAMKKKVEDVFQVVVSMEFNGMNVAWEDMTPAQRAQASNHMRKMGYIALPPMGDKVYGYFLKPMDDITALESPKKTFLGKLKTILSLGLASPAKSKINALFGQYSDLYTYATERLKGTNMDMFASMFATPEQLKLVIDQIVKNGRHNNLSDDAINDIIMTNIHTAIAWMSFPMAGNQFGSFYALIYGNPASYTKTGQFSEKDLQTIAFNMIKRGSQIPSAGPTFNGECKFLFINKAIFNKRDNLADGFVIHSKEFAQLFTKMMGTELDNQVIKPTFRWWIYNEANEAGMEDPSFFGVKCASISVEQFEKSNAPLYKALMEIFANNPQITHIADLNSLKYHPWSEQMPGWTGPVDALEADTLKVKDTTKGAYEKHMVVAPPRSMVIVQNAPKESIASPASMARQNLFISSNFPNGQRRNMYTAQISKMIFDKIFSKTNINDENDELWKVIHKAIAHERFDTLRMFLSYKGNGPSNVLNHADLIPEIWGLVRKLMRPTVMRMDYTVVPNGGELLPGYVGASGVRDRNYAPWVRMNTKGSYDQQEFRPFFKRAKYFATAQEAWDFLNNIASYKPANMPQEDLIRERTTEGDLLDLVVIDRNGLPMTKADGSYIFKTTAVREITEGEHKGEFAIPGSMFLMIRVPQDSAKTSAVVSYMDDVNRDSDRSVIAMSQDVVDNTSVDFDFDTVFGNHLITDKKGRIVLDDSIEGLSNKRLLLMLDDYEKMPIDQISDTNKVISMPNLAAGFARIASRVAETPGHIVQWYKDTFGYEHPPMNTLMFLDHMIEVNSTGKNLLGIIAKSSPSTIQEWMHGSTMAKIKIGEGDNAMELSMTAARVSELRSGSALAETDPKIEWNAMNKRFELHLIIGRMMVTVAVDDTKSPQMFKVMDESTLPLILSAMYGSDITASNYEEKLYNIFKWAATSPEVKWFRQFNQDIANRLTRKTGEWDEEKDAPETELVTERQLLSEMMVKGETDSRYLELAKLYAVSQIRKKLSSVSDMESVSKFPKNFVELYRNIQTLNLVKNGSTMGIATFTKDGVQISYITTQERAAEKKNTFIPLYTFGPGFANDPMIGLATMYTNVLESIYMQSPLFIEMDLEKLSKVSDEKFSDVMRQSEARFVVDRLSQMFRNVRFDKDAINKPISIDTNESFKARYFSIRSIYRKNQKALRFLDALQIRHGELTVNMDYETIDPSREEFEAIWAGFDAMDNIHKAFFLFHSARVFGLKLYGSGRSYAKFISPHFRAAFNMGVMSDERQMETRVSQIHDAIEDTAQAIADLKVANPELSDVNEELMNQPAAQEEPATVPAGPKDNSILERLKSMMAEQAKLIAELESAKGGVVAAKEKTALKKENLATRLRNQERPSKTPLFDLLPARTASTPRSMIYAGVGSRLPKLEADGRGITPEGMEAIRKVAKRLDELGYKVRTGDANGADSVFRTHGTAAVYRASHATKRTREIAKEIHPNPERLSDVQLNLMARNTFQIFGKNLDTPVDFVLAWTPDGVETARQTSYHTGGTGQAIRLASMKGIPVVNLNKAGWEQRLKDIIDSQSKPAAEAPVAAQVAPVEATPAVDMAEAKIEAPVDSQVEDVQTVEDAERIMAEMERKDQADIDEGNAHIDMVHSIAKDSALLDGGVNGLHRLYVKYTEKQKVQQMETMLFIQAGRKKFNDLVKKHGLQKRVYGMYRHMIQVMDNPDKYKMDLRQFGVTNKAIMKEIYDLVDQLKAEYERVRVEENSLIGEFVGPDYIEHQENFINRIYSRSKPLTKPEVRDLLSKHTKARVFENLDEAAKFGYHIALNDPFELLKAYVANVSDLTTKRAMIHSAFMVKNASGEALVVPKMKHFKVAQPERSLEALALKASIDNVSGQPGLGKKQSTARGIAKLREMMEAKIAAIEKMMEPKLSDGNYVHMDSPFAEFEGFWVHPDAVNVMKSVLGKGFSSPLVKWLLHINAWSKFMTIGFSGFHPIAILENVVANLRLKAFSKIHEGHLFVWNSDEFKAMMNDPAFQRRLIEAGLEQQSWPNFNASQIDQDLIRAQNYLKNNKHIIASWGVNGMVKYKNWMDLHLWQNMNSNSKAYGWLDLVNKRVAQLEAKGIPYNLKQLDQQAAEAINVAFGGMNWTRVMWSTPGLRQILQLLMFAPDWTLTNIGVALAGLGWIPGVGKLFTKGMSNETRRYAALTAWPGMFVFMVFWPSMVQAMIYAAFGDPDKDDRVFANENEKGKEFSIDITPIMRKLGWTNPDNPNERFFTQFAKQSWEVMEAVKDPLQTLKGKSSMMVKIALEQITGENMIGRDVAFKNESFWASILHSEEGIKGSRVGKLGEKFLPMTVVSWMGDQPPAWIAPTSKGMTHGKTIRAMQEVLNAYADPGAWERITGVPNYTDKLEKLVEDITAAASRNGVNVKDALKEAKSAIVGKYYERFWRALNDGNQAELERASAAVVRLGAGEHNFWMSIRGKNKRLGQPIVSQDAQRDALRAYMDWATRTIDPKIEHQWFMEDIVEPSRMPYKRSENEEGNSIPPPLSEAL